MTRLSSWAFAALFPLVLTADTEKVANGSINGGLDGWTVWSGAFDDSVSQDTTGGSIRLDFGPKSGGQAIAHQQVVLDQSAPSPFAYSCQARAEGLPADAIPSHRNFGIELCVNYQDGSQQWIAPKTVPVSANGEWERLWGVFDPPRAVKDVVFYARLRLPGKAWFDSFSVLAFPPPRTDVTGCRLVEDGGLVTLENDYLRAVFEPAKGGTCRSLVVKSTGVDYAGEHHPNRRLFTDRFRVGGRSYDRTYAMEVLAEGPDEVAIRLTLAAPQDYPFIEIAKTFRLKTHASALECEYTFRNLPAAMAAQVLEPYFRNGFAAFGQNGQHYVMPSPAGARSMGPTGGDTTVGDAADGWVAATDGTGASLVCEFDFAHLASEYFWLGGADNTTAEWTFLPVEIPAGGTFRTTQLFYPAPMAPDGAQNGICAAFRKGEDGALEVVASADRRRLLALEVETVATGGATQRVSRVALLSPEAPAIVLAGVPGAGLALARLSARDAATGLVVFAAEHPFSNDIVVAPAKPKAKPADVRPFELKLSEEIVTPHTIWMKPWAGGRPKVFFLVALRQAREVVELAQRMDLDHRVVRFADNPSALAWSMCDRYNQFTFADANLSLKHELARPLDAIVIAGNLWKHVDAANRARIAELAAGGVGLVEIGMKDPVFPDAVPDATGAAWINGAVDEKLLPFGAGRATTFTSGTNGNSRVVRFAYPAHGGLTPFVPYDAQEPSFRYQDYSLGVMARAVAWAAKRDTQAPDDAVSASERVVAADGTEIEHTWRKDVEGSVHDWSARVVRAGSGIATNAPARLVSEKERESELPFAVGESGYRGGSRRYLDPFRFAQYRKIGVNELRFWHTEESKFFDVAAGMGFRMDFPVASAHLWKFTQEFSEPWARTKDKQYLCRKPCLNDPDYLAKTRERVTATVRRLLRCRPTSLDCGDEGSLTLWGTPFDFCFSEHTLAAERKWLRETYGSLEALNASWGTAFADWDAVTPLTTDEALAVHSGDRQWAVWADHRRFMELTFCSFFALVKAAIEAEAPGMPLDMSGIQPPNGYTGMDFWLLSHTIGIWASYDGDNMGEIIRSFGRPMIRPWYGYGASGPDVARRVWFDSLRFKNFGVSYFDGSNVLNPDFTIPHQVSELMEALRFFMEGGGALLRTLDERPQVLIHYSQASIHAAQIEKRYDKFLVARDVWCRLLDDLCIPYRFVAYGEIEEGELAKTGARVLVLPESSALAAREVAEIQHFAARGGLVVGDDLTATHDIHCNLLPKAALADLLGAGGKAVSIGRVKPRYLSLRKAEKGAAEAVAYRDGIGKILTTFLPDTGVRFEQNGISGIRVFDLHPMDGGGRRFLGFVREGGANGEEGVIRVRLSTPGRVRDLRAERDFGVADSFEVRLAPCGAAFYEVTAKP